MNLKHEETISQTNALSNYKNYIISSFYHSFTNFVQVTKPRETKQTLSFLSESSLIWEMCRQLYCHVLSGTEQDV